MRKHWNECTAICEAAGLRVIGLDTKRRHLRVTCAEGYLTFPSTPSDTRWRHNMASVARRLARGDL